MNIEYIVLKDLPIGQIHQFEDNTVRNVAVLTRERTKSSEAYPYLTGELERTEVASGLISNASMEYGLSAGVDYAKYVWDMKDVNWTNKQTEPKWYLTEYRKHSGEILQNAVISAVRGVK